MKDTSTQTTPGITQVNSEQTMTAQISMPAMALRQLSDKEVEELERSMSVDTGEAGQ